MKVKVIITLVQELTGNPFVIEGYVSPEHFCDREKEPAESKGFPDKEAARRSSERRAFSRMGKSKLVGVMPSREWGRQSQNEGFQKVFIPTSYRWPRLSTDGNIMIFLNILSAKGQQMSHLSTATPTKMCARMPKHNCQSACKKLLEEQKKPWNFVFHGNFIKFAA